MCFIISDDSENAGYPHRSPWLLSSKENKALRECCWIDRGESLNDCDCCNRRSIEVEFLVEANISCEAPGVHQFGSIRIDWLNPRFTLQEQREKMGFLTLLAIYMWSYFITPRLTRATVTWVDFTVRFISGTEGWRVKGNSRWVGVRHLDLDIILFQGWEGEE